MPIHEITEEDLLLRLDRSHQSAGITEQPEGEAILFFTPFCGTCKLAERMLEVVDATGYSVPISRVNINFTPVLRERWQISSVPCLIILGKTKQVVRKEYALESVPNLYNLLRIQ